MEGRLVAADFGDYLNKRRKVVRAWARSLGWGHG